MELSILKHEHAEVTALKPDWARVKVLVDEDASKYTNAEYFLSLPNESATAKDKRKPAYTMGFCNPTQELITTMGEFILRQKIDRQTEKEPIKRFWDRADMSGQSLNDFVKNQASPALRAYGTVVGVVDKPRGLALNRAQELATGMPYLSILNPLQVLDWQYGGDGALLWFRYWKAKEVDRTSPFTPSADGEVEYVTWSKTDYWRHDVGGKQVETFTHGFGVVPVAIQAAFVMDSTKTLGRATFFSSSRHILMGNALLSKANSELLRFGSILLMADADWDSYRRELKKDPDTNLPILSEQAKEGEVLTTSDMANKPMYLEKNIEIAEKAMAQARQYFAWAAKSEATGQEAMPLSGEAAAPQSGVSKAYDFQDMDAALYAHGQDLQAFETTVTRIVCSILKVDPAFSIKYPPSFDVRSFSDKVAQVADLKRIGFASPTGLAIAQKNITQDLTTDPKEQETINAEIDSAQPQEPPPEGNPDGTV